MFKGTLSVVAMMVLALAPWVPARATDYDWVAGDGSWITPGNWDKNNGHYPGDTASQLDNATISPGSAVTVSGVPDLLRLYGGTCKVGTNVTLRIPTRIFGSSGVTADILHLDGGTVESPSGTVDHWIYSGTIRVISNSTIAVNTGYSSGTYVCGQFTDGATAGNLTLNGDSLSGLILTADNSGWTGNLIINKAGVSLSGYANAGGSPSAGYVQINSNATVSTPYSKTFARAIRLNGGWLRTADDTVSGTITLTAPGSRIHTGQNYQTTLSGLITDEGNGYGFETYWSTVPCTVAIDRGSGSSGNSYSGDTVVRTNTYLVGKGSGSGARGAFGSSIIRIHAGAFQPACSAASAAERTWTNTIELYGGDLYMSAHAAGDKDQYIGAGVTAKSGTVCRVRCNSGYGYPGNLIVSNLTIESGATVLVEEADYFTTCEPCINCPGFTNNGVLYGGTYTSTARVHFVNGPLVNQGTVAPGTNALCTGVMMFKDGDFAGGGNLEIDLGDPAGIPGKDWNLLVVANKTVGDGTTATTVNLNNLPGYSGNPAVAVRWLVIDGAPGSNYGAFRVGNNATRWRLKLDGDTVNGDLYVKVATGGMVVMIR